jgi:hypothetical protein
LAGFQVIIYGRIWVIAEGSSRRLWGTRYQSYLNIPSYRMEQAKKNRDTTTDGGGAN